MNTVLLIHTESALAALPWARVLAEKNHTGLLLLCVKPAPIRSVIELDAQTPSLCELAQACLDALDQDDAPNVRVLECCGPSLKRAVLDALIDLEVDQLILHGVAELQPGLRTNLLKQITRAAPYNVVVLGISRRNPEPGRVLFTQTGGRGEFGLTWAIRNFCDDLCPVIVISDPQAATRSVRVVRKAREKFGPEVEHRLQVVAPEKSIDDSLQEKVKDGDLVLFDIDEARQLQSMLTRMKVLHAARPEIHFSRGITRGAHAAGPGFLTRALERLYLHVPKMNRNERRVLHESLERGGRLSADFVIMLMLSATIAALGLILNSTATVIGAMLVAPLMTPMLATGMALIQGNAQLFRAATTAMLIGIAGALLVSIAVGLLSPWDDLSAQIVARGGPNIFDLGVAFFSGIAAAYALSRPGLTSTLVGVAIAVALVPPLASSGIALVKSEYQIAFGAAVLFITNLLAIILGAALVFRYFGLDVALRGNQSPRWARLTLLLLLVALLPTTGVLLQNLKSQTHDGVSRPYARPLQSDLRKAIQDRVARSPGAQIIFMAHSDIEHGFGIEIAIAVTTEVDSLLSSDIETLVKNMSGEDTEVRVSLLAMANPGIPR